MASSCEDVSAFVAGVWTNAFDTVSQRMRSYFARRESYQNALLYLRTLLLPLKRKNGWQIAEEAGEPTPYAMQHLLDRARWDCDGMRDELPHTFARRSHGMRNVYDFPSSSPWLG